MTKPNSPWSIKGVSAEARSAAKEGARISRQPLGKWMSQVIHKMSDDEAEGSAATGAAGGAEGPNQAASGAAPSSATTWQEAVVRLEGRLVESEARATSAAGSMDDALRRISERLDSIETYVLRRPRRSYLRRLLRR